MWILAVLVTPAGACSGPPPYAVPLGPVSAGAGLWLEVADDMPWTIEVDGQPITGSVVFSSGEPFVRHELFVPDVPLIEGQVLRVLPPSDWDVEVVDHVVGPALPETAPVGIEVVFGEVTDSACVDEPGPRRLVQARLDEGPGLVQLRDEATGELVRTGFVDGWTVLGFAREGRSRRELCVTPVWTRLDGSQEDLDTVCTEGGLGCATAPGAGWQEGLRWVARRRAGAR